MGVKIERRIFFIQMNDKINTNIMDSLNYNTNLNIELKCIKIYINNNNKKYIILDNISSSFILSHRLVLNDGKISYSA